MVVVPRPRSRMAAQSNRRVLLGPSPQDLAGFCSVGGAGILALQRAGPAPGGGTATPGALTRAAMIHQHATAERDKKIMDGTDTEIKSSRGGGTAPESGSNNTKAQARDHVPGLGLGCWSG